MASTKEKILTALKRSGSDRSDSLAKDLSLTPMAVRQHLYSLQEDGAVICETKPQKRGRPAKYWMLTEKADVYFQDAHRDLSLDIIDSIRATLGEDALDKLVMHRTEKQEKRYSERMKEAPTLARRLNTLAAIRSEEGYMAEVQTDKEGNFLLLENHCPICEAAKSCSGICSQELSLFKRLLADHAIVERSEHMLAGARRCAYTIIEKKE